MKSETKIKGSALFCAVIFTFLVTKVSSMYNNRDKYSVGDCISSSEFYKDKLDVEEVLKVGKEEYLVRNISRHGSVIHSYKANRDKWWANSSYFLVEKEYCEQ